MIVQTAVEDTLIALRDMLVKTKDRRLEIILQCAYFAAPVGNTFPGPMFTGKLLMPNSQSWEGPKSDVNWRWVSH